MHSVTAIFISRTAPRQYLKTVTKIHLLSLCPFHTILSPSTILL